MQAGKEERQSWPRNFNSLGKQWRDRWAVRKRTQQRDKTDINIADNINVVCARGCLEWGWKMFTDKPWQHFKMFSAVLYYHLIVAVRLNPCISKVMTFQEKKKKSSFLGCQRLHCESWCHLILLWYNVAHQHQHKAIRQSCRFAKNHFLSLFTLSLIRMVGTKTWPPLAMPIKACAHTEAQTREKYSFECDLKASDCGYISNV